MRSPSSHLIKISPMTDSFIVSFYSQILNCLFRDDSLYQSCIFLNCSKRLRPPFEHLGKIVRPLRGHLLSYYDFCSFFNMGLFDPPPLLNNEQCAPLLDALAKIGDDCNGWKKRKLMFLGHLGQFLVELHAFVTNTLFFHLAIDTFWAPWQKKGFFLGIISYSLFINHLPRTIGRWSRRATFHDSVVQSWRCWHTRPHGHICSKYWTSFGQSTFHPASGMWNSFDSAVRQVGSI